MIIGYDWSREHLKSFSSLPPNGSKNEINQAIRTFVAFVDSDIHLINFFKLVKLSGGEIVFSSSTSVLRIVKRRATRIKIIAENNK